MSLEKNVGAARQRCNCCCCGGGEQLTGLSTDQADQAAQLLRPAWACKAFLIQGRAATHTRTHFDTNTLRYEVVTAHTDSCWSQLLSECGHCNGTMHTNILMERGCVQLCLGFNDLSHTMQGYFLEQTGGIMHWQAERRPLTHLVTLTERKQRYFRHKQATRRLSTIQSRLLYVLLANKLTLLSSTTSVTLHDQVLLLLLPRMHFFFLFSSKCVGVCAAEINCCESEPNSSIAQFHLLNLVQQTKPDHFD